MKIGIFHELPFGGAERVVLAHAKILSRKHRVDLYYVSDKKNGEAEKFSSAHRYWFGEKKWTGKNWKNRLYKDTLELAKLYYLHKKIARDINRQHYDFVYVHPSRFTQAPFLLRFLKSKSVYFCQEPLRMVYEDIFKISRGLPAFKRKYESTNRMLRRWIDKRNILSASLVLANSHYSKNYIKKVYGVSAKVCYLGVDSELFKPLGIQKKYDLLFFGKKNVIRGYDLLEKALDKFGTKPRLKIIDTPISDKDLVAEYNKSKIVLALSRNEPFGLVPLEAMSCGIPVIAISEGGFKESIIDGKTGFLVQPDEASLFRAIAKLLNKKDLRAKMGEDGRRQVLERWTWEKSVGRLLKIIKYEE